jgi:hypothetical protein
MRALALSAALTFLILEGALSVHRGKQRIVGVCLTSVLFKIYIIVVILLIFLLFHFLGSILLILAIIRYIIILIIIKLLFVQWVTSAIQVHEVASGAIGLDHHYVLLTGASRVLPDGIGCRYMVTISVTSS